MATKITGLNISGALRLNSTSGPLPPANYDQYTVLQLLGTGTNNTNNSVFVDSSSNNFAITRYGNTTQGSFSPYSTAPGYWSNYFDGSGDYLTLPDSTAAIQFGNEDFTVEGWIFNTAPVGGRIVNNWSSATGTSASWEIVIGESIIQFNCSTNGLSNQVSITTTFSQNQWYHFAAVRNGNIFKLFVNGTESGSSTQSITLQSANTFTIGARRLGASYIEAFSGYISNLRIVKGTAVYTSNFTPSTTPLTAVSGTSLLTCQSNRFVDNSSNNSALTRNGDTSVSAFGPYSPSSSYNAATMGGSMYFDGSGDVLQLNPNTAFQYGTGDFTVEGWFYGVPNARGILYSQTTSGHNYFVIWSSTWNNDNDKRLYVNLDNQGFQHNIQWSPNTWNHFAVVRSSGMLTIYLNGIGNTPASANINLSNNTYLPTVGGYTHERGFDFRGYISNFRILKGTAVYTANFTPPTAPVTAISGTSLLLNGTNAAIYDASTKNVLETVGDAKVSTTVSANGSMYFDGTGDYLLAPSNDTQQLGAGNFTIEMWMRSSAGGALLTKDNNEFVNYGNLALGAGPTVYFHCNPNPNSETGRVVLTSTSTVTTNNWVHIAVSRTGNNWYLFVNGILESTASSGVGFWNTSSPFYVGCALSRSSPAGFYQGYINNLRVTKGIGRYTTNFTPPTRS